MADAVDTGVYAVIAPNMGKQIVAFQTTMETMAERFPGCFAGYSLAVVESHQRTKADTSGTAKAVVASFQKMGLQVDEVRAACWYFLPHFYIFLFVCVCVPCCAALLAGRVAPWPCAAPAFFSC